MLHKHTFFDHDRRIRFLLKILSLIIKYQYGTFMTHWLVEDISMY